MSVTLIIIIALSFPILAAWIYFVNRARKLKQQNNAIYNQSKEAIDSGSELMIFM